MCSDRNRTVRIAVLAELYVQTSICAFVYYFSFTASFSTHCIEEKKTVVAVARFEFTQYALLNGRIRCPNVMNGLKCGCQPLECVCVIALSFFRLPINYMREKKQ